MQKGFVLLFVVFASAFAFFNDIQVNDQDAADFLTGFSADFGLQNDSSALIVCANQSAPGVLDDLKDVLTDLQNKNITGAIDEMMQFFKDIESLKSVCASAVDPYLTTFGPAIQAFDNNKIAFDSQVAKNLASNPAAVVKDTIQMQQDLKGQNYTAVGVDFGLIAEIGLKTWLNSSTTTSDLVLAAQEFVEFDELSSSEESETEASSTEVSGAQASGTQFFEGFASAFGLDAAASSLLKCAETDTSSLISHITTLISDIQSSKWGQVVTDAVNIFTDIQSLQSDCPNGANPFITEFQPAFNAFTSNQQEFLSTLGSNCKDNLVEVLGDLGQFIEDISGNNYNDAGDQFGNILHISLKGILPN